MKNNTNTEIIKGIWNSSKIAQVKKKNIYIISIFFYPLKKKKK